MGGNGATAGFGGALCTSGVEPGRPPDAETRRAPIAPFLEQPTPAGWNNDKPNSVSQGALPLRTTPPGRTTISLPRVRREAKPTALSPGLAGARCDYYPAPARDRCRSPSGQAARRLFCLAPHGVFRAPAFARRAVSSYLAFSPLPRCWGGSFSVTLSVAGGLRPRCPRVVRGMAPCGVRTFLWRASSPNKHPVRQRSSVAPPSI